ncbi:MAG: hypothetical protein ACXVDA_06870 [Ktedonobacterales bacterium]
MAMGKLMKRDQLHDALPGVIPSTVKTRALSPRIALLAVGTLALLPLNWTADASGDPLNPLGTIITALCLFGGIGALLAAVLIPAPWRSMKPGWRISSLALLAVLTLSVVVSLSLEGAIIISGPPAYNSDAAAFNHYNAELVSRGINPYTADDRFWNAIHQFPAVGATPLRRGLYAHSVYGPALSQVVRDVRAELADPSRRGPEFSPASLHSYPALAFLIDLPTVWLGLPSTGYTLLLFAIGFLLAAGWGAPRGQRMLVWLVLLSNPLLLVGALRGSFEAAALLPALLAWRFLDRRWLSPVLLGLACAVKQIVWPLVPLYIVLIWRRDGPRAAFERLGIAAAAFLVPNLPFLIAAPRAWASSLLLPMTLPIFPDGVGLIAFPRAGLLPLWPSFVYAGLEVLTLALLVLWFARAKTPPRPEIALVVGLLPFLLAWHSLGAYFLVVPTLAVYASLPLLRADATPT